MTNHIARQHDEPPAQAVIDALIATREAINVAIRGFEALDQPIFDAEQERLGALSNYEDAEVDAPHSAEGDAAIAAAHQTAVAARDAVLALTAQCLKGQSVIRKAQRAKIDSLQVALGRRAQCRLLTACDPAALAALYSRRAEIDSQVAARRSRAAAKRASKPSSLAA